MKEHHYWVYILASKTRVLYVGVTDNIERRIIEHKTKTNEGFSSHYNVQRLVYFEKHQYIQQAIAREKQIKGWRRSKKVALIEAVNPGWKDRAEEWFAELTESERKLAEIHKTKSGNSSLSS